MNAPTPWPRFVRCTTCGMPDHDGDAAAHDRAYGHRSTYADVTAVSVEGTVVAMTKKVEL